jgi:hypothetical protein
MADDAAPGGPPPPADKGDRKAYLEEQIEKQKRGEPIDVAWVKDELQRVRQEQVARLESSQRNLRWLVLGAALILIVMWARNGATLDQTGFVTLGLIVVGLLAVFMVRRRGKP